MHLLITLFAAIISTAVWYMKPDSKMKPGTLSLMYWGASLMWFVDAVAGYIEDKAEFFNPPVSAMINEAYLGASVVALGLIIWLVVLLVKDPSGRVARQLKNN